MKIDYTLVCQLRPYQSNARTHSKCRKSTSSWRRLARRAGHHAGRKIMCRNIRSGPVVTKVGDLWVLGNHCLLCGDARDQVTYDSLLEGAKAEFVFTDPPYNVVI